MSQKSRLYILSVFIFSTIMASCSAIVSTLQAPSPIMINSAPTPTPFQPYVLKVYWSSSVPEEWIKEVNAKAPFQVTQEVSDASLIVTMNAPQSGEMVFGGSTRIYVAAVPFPTVTDETTSNELKAIWQGNPPESNEFKRILVSEATAMVFSEIWGKLESTSVSISDEADLITEAWKTTDSIVLLPFEKITPRWKILRVDGVSPLDKPLVEGDYPLTFKYYLTGNSEISSKAPIQKFVEVFQLVIPPTNRDETKMTVIVMSGTTALTRAIAYKINNHGTDYPIELVKDWFASADIRHISNEISFVSDCPDPDPYTSSMRFCASTKLLPTLEKLGVNLIELTGNHVNDYGTEHFAKTIQIYKDEGWAFFGGGVNADAARQPELIEDHGNKIAFIGCNPVGPASAWAKEDAAGAAKCDFEYYLGQIRELKSQGYVVVATYQHNEIYQYSFDDAYEVDFKDAADAGADIVQGSQAHYPMVFEFRGDKFIHYGLGNFLFDQMDFPVVGNRREFVDRHIIYDGRYINTELLTALLMDWSRPTPMSAADREQFLTDIFKASKLR